LESNFTVFLFSMDQLEDTDQARNAMLFNKMENFLGLSVPFAPFGVEIKSDPVGDGNSQAELIDICEPQYEAIRAILLANGAKTAAWLRDNFLQAPDVVVANPEHFVASIEAWGTDPCLNYVEEDLRE
jgi:hypothetical protein